MNRALCVEEGRNRDNESIGGGRCGGRCLIGLNRFPVELSSAKFGRDCTEQMQYE
jgi:hypothetical protein